MHHGHDGLGCRVQPGPGGASGRLVAEREDLSWHGTWRSTGTYRAVRDTVEPEDAITDAAECCPMEAITVRDQAGNLIAPQE